VAGLAALATSSAPARAGAGDVSLSTKARFEWALGTTDGSAQKLELQVEPELQAPLPRGFRVAAVGRLHADAYDRLAPGGPHQSEVWTPTERLELGDRVDLELRELYVEGRVGRVWLRLGKQQVVWGQADGLKVLDVVDPQDFREFILPDFDQSRIPLWTADVEVPVGPASLQLLWIPDPTTDDLPRQDALFAFTAPRLVGPRPPPGVGVDVERARHPRGLDASDAGVRLSGRFHGWDLSANYLFHYDDFPMLRRSVALGPGGPVVRVDPEYERAHVAGVTASNAFGNLTVRTEIAYTAPRWLPTRNEGDRGGAARVDELDAVLGLDWYGFSNTLLSLQIFPSFLVADAPSLLRDRLDTNLTFLARRTFRHETLVLQAIWLQNLNQGDGLVRPEVRYELRDGLWIWAGYDCFYGTRNGVFGEFDARDRAVLGFEIGL
jgi:hypothetical protein